MPRKSSIALFIAATSALSIVATEDISLKAGENDMGGLKEWNTDMPVKSDFILDEAAQKVHVYLLVKERIAGKILKYMFEYLLKN